MAKSIMKRLKNPGNSENFFIKYIDFILLAPINLTLLGMVMTSFFRSERLSQLIAPISSFLMDSAILDFFSSGIYFIIALFALYLMFYRANNYKELNLLRKINIAIIIIGVISFIAVVGTSINNMNPN